MPQQPPKLGVLFLLTPLREGRQVAVYTAGCFDPISTHAPAGGATEIISGSYGWRKFLLTPLREGRQATLCAWRMGRILFLLTPLREGRRRSSFHRGVCLAISTHAPAGGATLASEAAQVLGCISTHAPAGGATEEDEPVLFPADDFYSRPCGRGDSAHGGEGNSGLFHFYSRPCGRGDYFARSSCVHFFRFLLTPLREGRHTRKRKSCRSSVFLLTPLREGRRDSQGRTARRATISTHAPAGGATAARAFSMSSVRLFLLTPLREGRRIISGQPGLGKTFLLTPLREGRQTDQYKEAKKPYFYSRPCGRGDSNFPQVRHEVLRQIAER